MKLSQLYYNCLLSYLDVKPSGIIIIRLDQFALVSGTLRTISLSGVRAVCSFSNVNDMHFDFITHVSGLLE